MCSTSSKKQKIVRRILQQIAALWLQNEHIIILCGICLLRQQVAQTLRTVASAEFKFEIFYICRQQRFIKNGSKSCLVEGPRNLQRTMPKAQDCQTLGRSTDHIWKEICNQSKMVTIQGPTVIQLFKFYLNSRSSLSHNQYAILLLFQNAYLHKLLGIDTPCGVSCHREM